MRRKIKKILIVRPDGIGDFVIFSGVLQYYAALYKEYKIDLICSASVASLAKKCPFLDNIYIYSSSLWSRQNLIRRYLFFRALKKQEYDQILYPVYSRSMDDERILDCLNSSKIVVFDGDYINDTIGKRFNKNKRYRQVIIGTNEDFNEISRNLEFLRGLGFKEEEELNSKVWLTPEDKELGMQCSRKNDLLDGNFIICAPGAQSPLRIWATEKWVDVIRFLLKTTKLQIVFCGDSKDEIIVDGIIKQLSPNNDRIKDLSGKTTIPLLAALIENSRMVIASESGPIHIAAALNKPNICIAGGGHFGRFYPYGNKDKNRIVFHELDCYGCNWRCRFNSIKCIDSIQVENVTKEIEILLKTIA